MGALTCINSHLTNAQLDSHTDSHELW